MLQKHKQRAMVLVLTLLILSMITILTLFMLERTLLSVKVAENAAKAAGAQYRVAHKH